MLPATPPNLPATLKRLRDELDAQLPPDTTPLVVPSWAGPSGNEIELRIIVVDGRFCVSMSDRFRELAQKANARP